jgi:hypothetical protein
MGLGGTARKIQALAEKAEETYERLDKLRSEVDETRTTVTETATRVEGLEVELAEQRAILEAVAGELDVDLEPVTAEAHIDEAERLTDEMSPKESEDDESSS